MYSVYLYTMREYDLDPLSGQVHLQRGNDLMHSRHLPSVQNVQCTLSNTCKFVYNVHELALDLVSGRLTGMKKIYLWYNLKYLE